MNLNWEKKLIVVAEDEQMNYLFIKTALRCTNVNIIWTKTGRETIDVCNTELVDLVLMDVKMPELNGLEATVEIKKLNPNLPIIAQTAYAMEDDKNSSIEAGCDDFIAKPIRPQNLINLMCKYIDKH